MKKALCLESRRDGYNLNQLSANMTVGKFIDLLRDYPSDMPIFFSNDNGYTFGEITSTCLRERCIEEAEDNDDDIEEDVVETIEQPVEEKKAKKVKKFIVGDFVTGGQNRDIYNVISIENIDDERKITFERNGRKYTRTILVNYMGDEYCNFHEQGKRSSYNSQFRPR